MESLLKNYVILLLSLCNIPLALGCSEFNKLVHSLPYLSSPETVCTFQKECTSVQCTSNSSQMVPFSVGFSILSCDENPLIKVNANIPTLGINSWRAIFSDQSEQPIPGLFIPNLTNQSSLRRQGHLKVKLEKSIHVNSIFLSLTLKGCEHDSERVTNHVSCTEKEIISHQPIGCGKTNLIEIQKCSVHKPFDCGSKETCFQIFGQFEKGICICHDGYVRDSNYICSADTSELEQTGVFLNDTSSVIESTNDTAELAVNIVVPLLVFIVVAALFYAAFKHGLIHRLIVHFSGRQFERMTTIRQDDDDDDLSLA